MIGGIPGLRRRFSGTLISSFRETLLSASFVFTLAENDSEAFSFIPGSGASVSFGGVPALRRRQAIYIASAPGTLPRIEAVVSAELIAGDIGKNRLSASGRWLDALIAQEEGTPLFFYPERSVPVCAAIRNSPRLVFLAEGAGMAPVLSVLRHLSDQGEETRNGERILVLWQAENRDSLLQANRLRQTLETLPRTAVIPCLLHDPLWAKEKGELDEAKLVRLIPAFFGASGTQFVWESVSYRISGSTYFTEKMKKILKGLGVPRTLVRCR